MDTLKKELSMIDEVIPVGSKILYVDYPLHFNLGDLLIMKGTESFFADRRYSVVGRYSTLGVPVQKRWFKPFEALPKLDRDVIVVLHGGGNFGDIYPLHQLVREQIIRAYPENRIVVFPQTIHFGSEAGLDQTARIFQQHADLHVYVRDHNSLRIGQQQMGLKQVRLCPDMAHFLWNIYPNTGGKGEEVLWLMRRDVERVEPPASLSPAAGKSAMDWQDLITPEDVKLYSRVVNMERFNRLWGRRILAPDRLWYARTEQIIGRAIDLFQAHGKVVTSRLHGHIFASLLGIENVLLDNSYGKNSAYYNAWTHRVGYSHLYQEQK